jgi:hypothetical protein
VQRTLEREHDAVARIEQEPGVGDRRSRTIAAQSLEAVAIVRVDEAIGVKRVAVEERGAQAGRPRERCTAARRGIGDGSGLLGSEQIGRRSIAATGQVALDEAVDRAGDLIQQPGDIVVPRWRQRVKSNGAVGVSREHTVGEQGVSMAVEVEQRAKALHERDGTAVRVGDAVRARSATLPGEHLVQEHADDLAQQVAVAGEQKPHLTR